MPVFVEDPAQFSKQRLKLELVANNVVLPPGESKKQVYLDLYMKYVSTKRAADFSSDEEDQVQGNDAEDPAVQEDSEEEGQQDLEKMDVTELTDEELKARLLQFGVKAGPIVASTRALYERKLQRLLDTDALPNQNGNNDAVLYSDSDEDEDEEEEGEDDPGAEPAPQGPEPVAVVTGSRHSQLESKQTPTADVLNEMFPDAERTPTGISATRRRPIKGAAGRPVQFKYPDTPLSPASLERRDLHQRLVPMWLQALVFLGVAGVLYLVFGAMNEGMESPFAMLPGILSEGVELAEEPAS